MSKKETVGEGSVIPSMDIDKTIEYICEVMDKPQPEKTIKTPPKKYYETAVNYFREVKLGRIRRPEEIKTDEELDECIKNSMIKYLMFEKMISDCIMQGFKPEIDESEDFIVKGWNAHVDS